jgi:PAS domain S-box-containing protein
MVDVGHFSVGPVTVVIDDQRTVVGVSSGVEQWGLDDHLVGQPLDTLPASLRTEELQAAISSCLANGMGKEKTLVRNAGIDVTLTPFSLGNRRLCVMTLVTDAVRATSQSGQDRARGLFELATSDLIWEWRRSTGRVTWSSLAAHVLGIGNGTTLTVDQWFDLLHPDDRNRIRESISQALETPGTRWQDEYRMRTADGSYRIFLDQGSFERSDDGTVTRMAGSMRDMTAVREDERALRSSEDRIRRILTATRTVAWEWDLQTNRLFTTENIEDFNGLLDGGRLSSVDDGLKLLHPDDVGPHRRILNDAIKNRSSYLSTFRIVRPRDGKIIWAEEQGQVIEKETGQVYVFGVINDVTIQKEAILALQESEARFRKTFENAAVGIAHVATDGSWIRVNDRLCQITGYDREELLQLTFQDITHPDDLDSDLQYLHRVASGEFETYQIEKRYLTKSGDAVWVQLTVSAQRLPTGEIDYYISIVEDITERVAAQRALAESEKQFRTFADAAPSMLWVADEENRTTFLSSRWAEYTGLPAEEGYGFGWLKTLHPDDLARAKEKFVEASTDRRSFSIDCRVRRKDGVYRWAIDEGVPRFDSAGEWIGYIGSVIDVHDRQVAVEALRNSEKRYRTLFESMEEGFCVIEVIYDENGTACDYRFLEANPAFEKHTGLTGAVGKTAGELVPGLETLWSQTYGEVVRTGVPKQFEMGSEAMGRIFSVEAFRLPDVSGHQVGLLFADITERRIAERDLRLLNERLEERVAERTRQVRDLASMLTKAEQAERRRISQTLHDDLQQTLYGVQMKVNLIQRDAAAGRYETIGRRAADASRYMSEAIDTTRRLTVDISPPVLKNEGLADALGWLVTQMQELYGFTVTVTEEDPLRLKDEDMRVLLFQIIREVLFNAVKHSGTSEAHVTLCRPDEHIRIIVEDRGRGFPPEALGNKTSGFGLQSARERLDLFDGRLYIESVPRQGTTIVIEAPDTEPDNRHLDGTR